MSVTKKMITDHAEAVAQLKKYKKLELELRNKIISQYKLDSYEGVQKKDFKSGDFVASIEIGLKMSRKLDSDAVDSLWSTMSEGERNVVSHKPSLDLTAYRKLLEIEGVDILHQAIVETPAQASLKISVCD